jgi:hypothetical protein
MAFIGATPSSTFTSVSSRQTFVSDFLRTEAHDSITGSVLSNTGGDLYIEQSPDGTNWDISNYTNAAAYTHTANNSVGFSEAIILPYWRVKFVCSGNTVPTTLRLHARTSDIGAKY